MKMLIKIIILCYTLVSSQVLAHDKKKKSLQSHEHGVGILNISQDKNILLFEFEAPGYDIVGFEYEAKNDEDKKKIENALNIFSDHRNIILPSSSARCKLVDNSSKVINEGKHSEFLISYKFNCENISKLNVIYLKYFNKFENCKKTNIKIFGKNKKSAFVINKSKRIIKVKNYF